MTVECEKVGVEYFDTAPTIHKVTKEVAASPDDVFAVLLDASSWVTWALPITGVDWTSGFPIEVGSTRTVHMRGGLVAFEEFIAYEHGARMAFRFNQASKKGVRAFAEDYQVIDLGGGRCVVEWTMAMDTGRSSGIVDKVIGPVMSRGLRFMLGRFVKLVESGPTLAEVD